MFEAMSNLVSNAIKFTPAGGDVRLCAGLTPAGVRVDVVDSGPGIPAEERDSVLQRFYRSENCRDVEGFGLGLSIVAAIVRLHGFQLEIAAAHDGGGTRVSLRCWPEELVGAAAAKPG
jgi:signal transduction histidine kinase